MCFLQILFRIEGMKGSLSDRLADFEEHNTQKTLS